MRKLRLWTVACCLLLGSVTTINAVEPHRVLVEAESFDQHGGWKLDTQFIHIVGSPYMLAHGLGRPVDDATTAVEFPATGTYRLFVRTKDWVARWNASAPGNAPGKFQLVVNGKALETTFGAEGADWHWQDGGTVDITDKTVKLALHDLTGFEGRADAIYFTTDLQGTPPPNGVILPAWRRDLLGLSAEPAPVGPFDLVVVGGGYSGMGAAVSAARMGLKVALIQERPVLGGNGSSEIRVWAQGETRRGRYPNVGDIIEELSDHAGLCPGPPEIYEDEKKIRVVGAEPNISLYLNHHAYAVDKEGDAIKSVTAFDTRTSQWKKFAGRFFVDATGHGTIGALAGADLDMTMEDHMGMTNLWRWQYTDQEQSFPETTWALQLEHGDFPYPRRPGLRHGAKPDAGAAEWYWETGFDKHPIDDLELMRDTNFRAAYGAFNAMKNHGAYADQDPSGKAHATAQLIWMAYIGGPRESRRLMGDVILTREDILDKREFPDGCVPSTWSIDLHYAKQQYAKKYPDNPFISYAQFDHRVDRKYGYPIPYRCFYSRNVTNLFMAGRCISVTHEALGTTRVMKTCGMMGEVVGKAASICVRHDTTPRGVYEKHWDEMDTLLKLPGKVRRLGVDEPFLVNDDARDHDFIDGSTLPGVIIDDIDAKRSGGWEFTDNLAGHVNAGYLYTSAAEAEIRYDIPVKKPGRFEVRMSYQPHSNRSTKTSVTVIAADGEHVKTVNQRIAGQMPHGFHTLGVFEFTTDKPAAVIIHSRGADGVVNADAVQIIELN